MGGVDYYDMAQPIISKNAVRLGSMRKLGVSLETEATGVARFYALYFMGFDI